MKRQTFECYRCGHEQTDWLPFHEIYFKYYCDMCVQLGIDGLIHFADLKEKGFEIITGGGVPKVDHVIDAALQKESGNKPINAEVTCHICDQPATKDMPIFTMKGHGFCVACLALAIKTLKDKMQNGCKITNYLDKREN